MGLRETKKERTRAQLLEAALALIGKKGFEQTTIHEIADAVQVSARTFIRYFPAKEDVVVAWVEDEFAIIVEELANCPRDVPPFRAASAVMRAAVERYETRGAFFLTIEKVIAASPDMTARKAARGNALVRELGEILAQRMGLDAGSSLTPNLIAGTVFAVVGAAIRSWVAQDGQCSLVGLYDEALDQFDFRETWRPQQDKSRAIA
jgi:AcrR family transcriptional regulator